MVNPRPAAYQCRLEGVPNIPHHDTHGTSTCQAPPLSPHACYFTHHQGAAEGTPPVWLNNVFGRELYGEVKPQEKSTRGRWLTTNCKTILNCCQLLPHSGIMWVSKGPSKATERRYKNQQVAMVSDI